MKTLISTLAVVLVTGCTAKPGLVSSVSDVISTPSDVPVSESNPEGTKYLAKNVIFNSAQLAQARVAGTKIDTTTKVLAANIVVADEATPDVPVGRLTSTNLKDALANEVATGVASVVKSGHWHADHKIASRKHHADPAQSLYFDDRAVDSAGANFTSNGKLEIDTCLPILGNYGCVKWFNRNCWSVAADPDYEVVSNSVIIVTFDAAIPNHGVSASDSATCDSAVGSDVTLVPQTVVLQVIESTATKLVLMNASINEVAVLSK